MACAGLTRMRFDLEMAEVARLMLLSTTQSFWTEADHVPDVEALRPQCRAPGEDFRALREVLGTGKALKILFIPDQSGGIVFDIALVRALLRQGHKVALAVKNGFYFASPSFWDWENDPELAQLLEGARLVPEERLSKNELLQAQREHPFLVISDGTREDLNLYRTSVTFARAWKEADLVLAKGSVCRRRLIQTSQSFTRDIFCYDRGPDGAFRLAFRPKPEHVRKFGEAVLAAKADQIIMEMRRARAEGKSVMFYSAIIGSVPGQTKVAIEVVDAFVKHLRSRLEKTFIINPAEHFEEGMDADDLMFMWERVQRCGLLDIWRFQSVEDIEQSFELMGQRVPPTWAGKDSTFSTGCTKEMRIALEMQKRHPEMQIIGPSPEKFFRRREYGIGKYSDAVLG